MDRIPNRIIRVLRQTLIKLSKNRRSDALPLSWVVAKLVEYPGAVETLVSELNGRFLATYKGPNGSTEPCCGGHRKSGAAYDCVKRKDSMGFYATVPLVGSFKVSGLDWELSENWITDYPTSEQMKTVEDITSNPFRPARRAA